MAKHQCPNAFAGEGANGGCYVQIRDDGNEHPTLEVGWSCVRVYSQAMPITWLAEIIAIASAPEHGGVAGFLEKHRYGGASYALACDPAPSKEQR